MFQVCVDCVREYSSLTDFQISFSTYSADRFRRNIKLNTHVVDCGISCSKLRRFPAVQWNRSRGTVRSRFTDARMNCPIRKCSFRSLRTTVRPQNSAWRIIAFTVPRHVTRPINKDGRVNTPRACLIVRLRYYRLRCILAIRLTAGAVCASRDLLRCEIVHALARTVRK